MTEGSNFLKTTGRALLVVIFFAAVVGFAWSYVNYQDVKKRLELLSSQEGQTQLAQQQVDALLASVGNLILLPEGEDPLVATIQDAEALAQEEPFYQNAKNGDKLIVYTQKAIIYNPDDDRLVNVGPVFIQDQSFAAAQDQPFDSAPDQAEESQGEEEGGGEVLPENETDITTGG